MNDAQGKPMSVGEDDGAAATCDLEVHTVGAISEVAAAVKNQLRIAA